MCYKVDYDPNELNNCSREELLNKINMLRKERDVLKYECEVFLVEQRAMTEKVLEFNTITTQEGTVLNVQAIMDHKKAMMDARMKEALGEELL